MGFLVATGVASLVGAVVFGVVGLLAVLGTAGVVAQRRRRRRRRRTDACIPPSSDPTTVAAPTLRTTR